MTTKGPVILRALLKGLHLLMSFKEALIVYLLKVEQQMYPSTWYCQDNQRVFNILTIYTIFPDRNEPKWNCCNNKNRENQVKHIRWITKLLNIII